ncbi:MAG TPA: IS110 family transposase [bacterium]|nr:IS110 family transposase [bacterium]HPP12883.1 IS110 family transposase [bacterium]
MSKNQLVVSIDPGSKLCQALIAEDGRVLETFPFPNLSFSGMEKLLAHVQAQGQNPVFVFEATNVFWRPLYWHLSSQGYHCRTVSSSQTGAFRKTRMRRTQTDTIDCKQILEIHRQNESHPTRFLRQPLAGLRELTRFYTHLSDTRTNLAYRLREYLYQLFPEWSRCFSDLAGKTSLSLIQQGLANPAVLVKTRIDKLARIMKKTSNGRFGLSQARTLKEHASHTFGMNLAQEDVSFNLSTLAQAITYLAGLMRPLEQRISSLLAQVPQQLLTVPGVHVIPAASFVSELGDPTDFSKPEQVIAWFGLDVVWKSSAGKGRGYHISKAGSPYARKWLYVAAGEFVRHFPPARQKYLKLFKEHHLHKKAMLPITADLAKLLFVMYRDNSPFDPARYH